MTARVAMRTALLVALLMAPVVAGAEYSVSWDEHGLNYYFGTSEDTFTMYENVPLSYIVTNTSEETLYVEHPCSGLGGISFIVWAPGSPSRPEQGVVWGCCGCFDEMWLDAVAPGEQYVRNVNWEMWDMYEEAPISQEGTYTLEGEFRANSYPDHEFIGHAFTLEIEILSESAAIPDPEVTWSIIKALYR